MRWTIKIPLPKPDSERTIVKYLLFPRYIGGEIRWLERAKFLQKYQLNRWHDYRWVNIKWIPDDNEADDADNNEL